MRLYLRSGVLWYQPCVLAQIGYPISFPPYERTSEDASDQEIAWAVRRSLAVYSEGVPVRTREQLAAVPNLWSFAGCRTWRQFARNAFSVAISQPSPRDLEVRPLAATRKMAGFIQTDVQAEILDKDCSDSALGDAVRRAIAAAKSLDVS